MPPSGKMGSGSHNSPRRGGLGGSGRSFKSSPSRPSGRGFSIGHKSSSSQPKMGSLFGSRLPRNKAPRGGFPGTGFPGMGMGMDTFRPAHRSPSWMTGMLLNTLLLSGRNHDYTYIPEDYTDTSGKVHKRGYYDEEGTYYKNVGIDNQEVVLECPYCGTKTKLVWKSGTLPSCPNCGGTYDVTEDQMGTGQGSSAGSAQTTGTFSQSGGGAGYGSSDTASRRRLPTGVMVLVLCIVISIFICLFALNSGNSSQSSGSYYSSSLGSSTYDSGSHYSGSDALDGGYYGQELYVSETRRTATWDEDLGCYYDPESSCYFYFNYETDPPQWAYWYEGISSNYGDYGWMEYDDDEDCWYIMTSEGQWKKLPNRYSSKPQLWHMDNAYQE